MSKDEKQLPVDWNAIVERRRQQLAADLRSTTQSNLIRLRPGKFVLPDETAGSELNVVILGYNRHNLYYDQPYKPDVRSIPACFAIGSDPATMAPSPNAPKPQSDQCITCPMNQFGSHSNGKGKACRNSFMLVLCAANDPDADLLRMSVPPTSMSHLIKYLQKVQREYSMDAIQLETKIFHDTSVDWAAPRFEVANVLDAEMQPRFMSRLEEAESLLTMEPDVSEAA